jgi:LAO/AO transport system kinase
MSKLEAADLTLVSDLTGAPSLKQRRALAKVITLLESTRLDHRQRAGRHQNLALR